MAFSTNQARQFYVMKGTLQTAAAPTSVDTVEVVTTKNAPYIVVNGAAGNTRSDILTSIESVKITDARALAKKRKSVKVELADGAAVIGQDYTLTIEFQQFVGMSDEEKYFKYGFVRPTTVSASDFYKAMAISLAQNFSKELVALVSFQLISDGGNVTVTKNTKAADLDGTYTGLLINEEEQEWTLGIKPQVPVLFTVTTGTIKNANSVDVIWGTITDNTATFAQTIGNGKDIADLEYFCMGERGDIYRNINWPNSIHTEYLVDPTVTYDVLDVHFSFAEGNENPQKSEKDLTVVMEHDDDMTQLAALANALAKAAGFENYKKVDETGAVVDVAVA